MTQDPNNPLGNVNDLSQIFSSMPLSPTAGGVSPEAQGILINNVSPLTLAGAQGPSFDDFASDQGVIIVDLNDESSSMWKHRQAYIAAYNDNFLKALQGSKGAEDMVMSTWMFADRSRLLHSYMPIERIQLWTPASYDPNGMTTLYDTTLDALTSTVAYVKTLQAKGARLKVLFVIKSDGEDTASTHSADDCKTVITDLLQTEIWTIALLGFGRGFKAIGQAMGIPDSNIEEATKDEHAIRRALDKVSKSLIKHSQTITNTTASGGFFS